MAKISEKLVNNDIISLVHPGGVIIGRFIGENADGTITVFKPQNLTLQQSARGLSVGFTDYSEGNFLTKRDLREFDPDNFMAVDKTETELATHFNSAISGIKAPPKSKLIGLGG